MKSATFPRWVAMGAVPDDAGCSSVTQTDTAAEVWLSSVDIQYFHSELQLALTYLDMIAAHPDQAQECVSRALRLYVLLSGWVQSNGGHSALEQRLQQLRWQIARVQEAGEGEAPLAQTRGTDALSPSEMSDVDIRDVSLGGPSQSRRQEPRFQVTTDALIVAAGEMESATLVNLSASGAMLHVPVRPNVEVGSEVQAHFLNTAVNAVVRHISPARYGVHIGLKMR